MRNTNYTSKTTWSKIEKLRKLEESISTQITNLNRDLSMVREEIANLTSIDFRYLV